MSGPDDAGETFNGNSQLFHKVTSIKRKASRDKAKVVQVEKILKRKHGEQVQGILKECPDIGKQIEAFVKDNSVGADAWCRTGILTFDGNKEVKEKVTFDRIRLHLEELYNRKFGLGTVVQLCCPRNKRHLSAK